MSGKEDRALPSSSDAPAASSWAAGSVARFFKGKKWKIISFFPNSPCSRVSPPPAADTGEKQE